MRAAHTKTTDIDPAPNSDQLAAIEKMISAELVDLDTTKSHPLLPHIYDAKFPPLLEREHARIAAGDKREQGIDMSRYEALEDPPPIIPPSGDVASEEIIGKWRRLLEHAYTTSSFLGWRQTNLALLEKYGNKAWPISNWAVEADLRTLEKDLAEMKNRIQELEESRRQMQGSVQGEMVGLEEAWRKGIGRMIETQAAAEELRHQILERRREAAS